MTRALLAPVFRLLSLALLCCLMAQPALALAAPMSKNDLLSKSDLVALVRILAVTCTGMTKHSRTGEELPSYSAKAELIEVIKGDEMKGGEVAITFHAISTGAFGAWTVYYYPGEMVWTHLIKAAITELPTTPGETVSLRRTRLEQPAEPLTPKP
jgi:hypothetical protein